ncbi:DUF3105 domain-containing protein [Deinococcus yavapaiensis]|uniref:Uncharacterized protein DUF3105 n=1 Tax=Deinococcus yavapaiensis KR-236 TaxID=694435 RepID=A0A318S1B5_9DEIO|nr:DUF3105 domain-containing protein [Deinococcus yavapaiensis]PYE47933.1 uncharacterized protein DUF3105 [Deinococcus yavapaiensis KR-236]
MSKKRPSSNSGKTSNTPGKTANAPSKTGHAPGKITNAQKLRQAQRKAQLRTWIITGVSVAAVVGGVIAWNATTRVDGVTSFSYAGSVHQQGTVQYAETPPVGGPHHPAWFNCGVYRQPITKEQAVHSMEHGAVWITYRPDLPQAQVKILERLVDGYTYTLLSPYPGLDTPVVISAWNRQLRVQDVNDPRLGQFLAKFEQGSQAPERGAPCIGGASS